MPHVHDRATRRAPRAQKIAGALLQDGLLRRPQNGSSKPRWRSTTSRVVEESSASIAEPYGRERCAPKRRCRPSARPMGEAERQGAGDKLFAVKTELELRHLRVFVAVVDAGTRTRAARALGISQSTVSETLAGLERAVGVELFQRRPGARGADPIGRGSACVRSPHVRPEPRASRRSRRRVDKHPGHARGVCRRVDQRVRSSVATGGPSRALAGGARGSAHRRLRRDPRACRRRQE